MTSGSIEDTRTKWEGWCDRIGNDLLDLATCTHIYKGLIAIIAANPFLSGTASTYWHFLHLTYVDYALAAVRRQLKRGHDEISLARLLGELQRKPAAISRDWFQGNPPEVVRAQAVAWSIEFFNRFAAVHAEHIDPATVDADLSRMKSALASIEAIADQLVAHLDKRPPLDRPQPAELYAAIDVLLEVFHRYRTLVCRGAWNFNLPQSVGEEWKDLFRRPWIEAQAVESDGTIEHS